MESVRRIVCPVLIVGGLLLALFAVPCPAQTALPRIDARARNSYVAVLMWHDVVAQNKQVWFDTTIAEFRAQLEAIRKRHCTVITLDTLYKHLATGAPVPPRPIVLTFDDNYKGLVQNAYPILKEYGYPATFFAHTDYVGVTTVKEHCTWQELQTMEASGLITVQSQTRSHPADMRLLSEIGLRKELLDSKRTLEKRLGKPIIAFSYPDGKYDDRVAEAGAKYGYRMAFMEDWGDASASRSLLLIHRYSVHRRFDQALQDLVRAWRNR